ncbi:MAG: class I SAM-dependent methyltransferase [Flavobacteriales bacterium]
MKNEALKEEVHNFWNKQSCGTQFSDKEKYSKEFFEEIELDRYTKEPEILSFADFKSGKDKKVLEVGVGAATDFLQWAKNGAELYGIDLTPEAVSHAEHRLQLYNLAAKEIRVSDAENLPFQDNFFDIVYSWGVIHHSPDTPKALSEIIRVLKPSGKAKLMVYNRKSVLAYVFWIKHAGLKLKWNQSVADVLWNKMESFGTKGYTIDEAQELLKGKNVKDVEIKTVITYYDKLKRFNKFMQLFSSILLMLMNKKRAGWFLTIEFTKQ